ncbi:histone H1-delta-like [Eriocheir sinensis]|uniref:histone H1-delta-like n=1 Tax=Eriocheir sinensis TaxID=95602 RepID=UPI0021C9273C|nr:histone H1-delta-like [Eriocheir sinensis]
MADAAPAATPTKKATKAKAAPKKPVHPSYAAMIADAIGALKERSGSSRQAILKYIVAHNKVGDEKKAGVRVKLALRKQVQTGALKQVKGSGASGSFKLAEDVKEAKAKPAKKKVVKKPAAKKVVKKPAAKKVAKKPAAKKAAKKPAAKKAVKKPVAKKPTPKKAVKKPAPKKAAKKPAPKK